MLEVGDVRKFPDLFCRSLAMNCSFIFYHQRIYSPSSCSVDLILQGSIRICPVYTKLSIFFAANLFPWTVRAGARSKRVRGS